MKVTCCHVVSLLAAFAAAACGPSDAPAASSSSRAAPAPDAIALTDLVVEADARRVSDELRAALADPRADTRRYAVRALARIHSVEEAPGLQRALRDTDPDVRAWASLGLGALESDAPADAAGVLARALAAEPEPAVRALVLRDLGRLRREEGLAAIAAALRSDVPVEMAAACYAAAEYGLGGQSVPAAARSRIAALLGPSEDVEVRIACAYALARLPAPEVQAAEGEAVALTLAAADEDPEVRVLAFRALARQPSVDLETLVHGTRDRDWRVGVQAFRSLAVRAASAEGGPDVYAHALDAAFQRAFPDGRSLPGGPLHVLLSALDAAAPLASSTPVHDAAVRLHGQLERLPAGAAAGRDQGLAHCAAAELVDRARGWPSRIDACGLEQVQAVERQARAAAILGDLQGAEEQRAALLGRLYRHGDASVREAALRAAARVWHPDATDLVVRALHEEDSGVLTAAAEAIAVIARRVPTEVSVPPPLPVEATETALRAAVEELPTSELEALATWVDAVDATDARTLEPRVHELAAHPSYAVRDRAKRVLARWGSPLPEEAVPPPPNVIAASDLPPLDARPRVRLTTDRGDVVIELRPDVAPTTVARFLGLVRDGFYDGLTFHRVVPGFVAQGGDPRGDGYGGPGFWQRCEDSRLPYRRGTVGMALAGRDTGGSQFFITYAAQPHLDGRYTAFGTVVEGLDHLDELQAGDHIRTARIVSQ